MSRKYALCFETEVATLEDAEKVVKALCHHLGTIVAPLVSCEEASVKVCLFEDIHVSGDPAEGILLSITHTIWKDLGRYQRVEFSYVCLDDLPHDHMTPDEDDYTRWEACRQ